MKTSDSRMGKLPHGEPGCNWHNLQLLTAVMSQQYRNTKYFCTNIKYFWYEYTAENAMKFNIICFTNANIVSTYNKINNPLIETSEREVWSFKVKDTSVSTFCI